MPGGYLGLGVLKGDEGALFLEPVYRAQSLLGARPRGTGILGLGLLPGVIFKGDAVRAASGAGGCGCSGSR